MSKHYDAIIIGARCAGAATGMLLARAGARVLVVDHDQPGADTMSTHALMRAGVMQLQRWGLLETIRASGAQPIRQACFIYGAERIEVDIRPAYGTEALYAPRRYVLDAALARAAEAAGVALRYRVGCVGVLRDAKDRVCGVRLNRSAGRMETVTADLVIGADGRRSTVARLVDAPIIREGKSASAVLYGYFGGIENRGYRWYWENGAAGGVIPTNEDESCVFLSAPDARAGDLRHKSPGDLLAAAAALLPALGEDLAGATGARGLVFFSGQRGRMRAAAGAGWALVGDAGNFKDPLTAHGISDALRDAEALARAVIAGDLGGYAHARDALSENLFRLSDEIASFAWTLDGAKTLHAALNVEMKAEQEWIARLGPFPPAPARPNACHRVAS